jgi:hypothetical protein
VAIVSRNVFWGASNPLRAGILTSAEATPEDADQRQQQTENRYDADNRRLHGGGTGDGPPTSPPNAPPTAMSNVIGEKNESGSSCEYSSKRSSIEAIAYRR